MKEERFPHPGSPLHQWGDQLGQKGSFRGSEESAATSLQEAEWRKTSTDSPGHLAALPSLRGASVGMRGGLVLKLGLQKTDVGRRLGLAAQRSPKGLECGPGHNWGCVQDGTRSTIEAPLLTHTREEKGRAPP